MPFRNISILAWVDDGDLLAGISLDDLAGELDADGAAAHDYNILGFVDLRVEIGSKHRSLGPIKAIRPSMPSICVILPNLNYMRT